MQSPTCTGIRIRSARDANILFHAVALDLLPLITRRLDEAERLQVRSGCVYVWEERNPSYFDFNGQEMKRFTEGASIPTPNSGSRSRQSPYRLVLGRSWGPSKARDVCLPISILGGGFAYFLPPLGIPFLLREGERYQVPNGRTDEIWS